MAMNKNCYRNLQKWLKEHGSWNKGKKHSEKARKRMSESHKGKKMPLYIRKKISEKAMNKRHSSATRKKMSISHQGKQNPNWQGGISSQNERFRGSSKIRLWKKAVFIRDNYICQKYKIRGGKIVSHHINNFADFPELRTIVLNGITLSERAHKEFHSIYGIRNNTHEQLREYLIN